MPYYRNINPCVQRVSRIFHKLYLHGNGDCTVQHSEAVDNGSKIKKKMTPSMKIFEVGNYLVLVGEIKFYFSFDSDSNINVPHILSFPFFSVTGSFSIKQKDLVYI